MFRRYHRRRVFTRALTQALQVPEQSSSSHFYRYASIASLITYAIYLTWLCYSFMNSKDGPDDLSTNGESARVQQRHLLSLSSNVTGNASSDRHAGLPWERCDFETSSGYQIGWVIHHLWWILFFFIGLAVVCDDFFVPALEIISEKLKLSEDVAGATFMAAGSSAPELFTSLIGVAQETDVGVGAIVGSAVFNILVIISLTGALAGQVLQLDWRPLTRDVVFYAISILAFLISSYDGLIMWYEAVALLSLYILYIVAMIFNPRLMKLLNKARCCLPSVTQPDVEATKEEDSDTEEEKMNHPNVRVETEDGVPQPVVLHQRRVSFQKSSFSGGHARRLSLHHQLHSTRSSSPSLGNIWDTTPHLQAQHGNRKDSGFLDDHEKVAGEESNSKQSLGARGKTLVVPTIVMSGESGDTIEETTEPVEANSDPAIDEYVELPAQTIVVPPKDPEVTEKREDMVEEDEDDELVVCSPKCCPTIKSTPPCPPEQRTRCNMVVFGLKWCLYVIAFPYYFLCTFTIPDCSKEHNKKWFLVTFLLSILWILVLSFAMVTVVSRTGCIIGVDEFVMGLVIVAVGTSVPDCLSSILVARDGFGDMAVSNAIGSNVFDIDLGLGFPFLLRILIDSGRPLVLLDDREQEMKRRGMFALIPHVKFAVILLALLSMIFLLFLVSKFRLNKLISVSFIILYVIFITYSLIQQLVCNQHLC